MSEEDCDADEKLFGARNRAGSEGGRKAIAYLKLVASLGKELLEVGAKLKDFFEAALEIEDEGAEEEGGLVVNGLGDHVGELLLILAERHCNSRDSTI